MYISTNIEILKDLKDVKKMLTVLKEVGFDCYDYSMSAGRAEFNCVYDDDYLEKAKQIRADADKIGILCNQTHAPFPSWEKGNDALNAEMFPLIVRAIEITGILGGKLCVVHPYYDATPEENAEFYNKLLPYAKKNKVKIGLENLWNWENGNASPAACYNSENFRRHLDLLDEEWFVANLDIGHAEMMKNCGVNSMDLIYALKDRLEGLHVHDNNLHDDNHAFPFTMDIDFIKICQALKEVGYKGDVTLEVGRWQYKNLPQTLYPSVARFLADVTNYLRELIEK